jgi:hypothetical protein
VCSLNFEADKYKMLQIKRQMQYKRENIKHGEFNVPHSGSGLASMSSLSGAELLGFRGLGMGGLIG